MLPVRANLVDVPLNVLSLAKTAEEVSLLRPVRTRSGRTIDAGFLPTPVALVGDCHEIPKGTLNRPTRRRTAHGPS